VREASDATGRRVGILADLQGPKIRLGRFEGGSASLESGAPSLSDKDVDAQRFALALGVDLVALSFVRRPSDAELVRRVMDAAGRRVPLIAQLVQAQGPGGVDPDRGRRSASVQPTVGHPVLAFTTEVAVRSADGPNSGPSRDPGPAGYRRRR